MTIRFDGSHVPNVQVTNLQPEGYTRAKAEAVRLAGFEPSSLAPEFFSKKISEIRGALLSVVAAKFGYTRAEAMILAEGREAVDEALLKRGLRRISAGVRILPAELRAAVDTDKVVLYGEATKVVSAAFPNAERIKDLKELSEKITAGFHVLIPTQRRLNLVVRDLARKGMDVEAFKKAAWSPERIQVQIAVETSWSPSVLAALLNKAEVSVEDPNLVVAQYGAARVTFNLATCVVEGQELLPNQYAMGQILDRRAVLALFALSLHKVVTEAQAKKRLKGAVHAIFVERNTGYGFRKDDSRHEAAIRGKVGLFQVLCTNYSFVSLNLSDKREYTDVVAAATAYAATGVEICIDDKAGALFVGDGARAKLLGRRGDEVVNNNDATSEAKELARPKRAARLIAETVNARGDSTIAPSGLRVVKRDGTLMQDYGTPMTVLITNSILGPGSGVALARPGKSYRIRLVKTVSNSIPAIYLPGGDDSLNKADLLKDAVKKGLKVNRDHIGHGGTVFSYNDIPYGMFDGEGMTAKVVGDPSIEVNPKSEGVTVAVKVAVEFEYSANKYSVDALKATGLEYVVELVDTTTGLAVEQPDLILTKEEIKGAHVILLRAWADDVSVDLDNARNMGFITLDDYAANGVKFDPSTGLNEAQMAAFVAWRNARSMILEKTVQVDDETYYLIQELVKAAKADPEFAAAKGIDPDAFRFGADGHITQTIQAIKACMVLGIEVSTVLENVGRSSMIGEQLVSLKHIDSEIGDNVWRAARKQRKAVLGMLDMARKVRSGHVMTVGATLEFDKDLHGRRLMEHMAKTYPAGLTIVDHGNNVLVTLRFDALCQLGALLPGGAATGIALSVIQLLLHLHVSSKGIRSWDHYAKRYTALVASGALSWAAESKKALGSVTRTKKELIARKVKTTFSRTLPHEHIGINPYDTLVEELLPANEIPADRSDLEGMVLSSYGLCSRAPMISVFGGHFMITSEAPVGMVLVKAYSWAYGNEGDGDGDPISVFILRNKENINRIRPIIASSPFGPSAYRTAHGDNLMDHPYTEFYTENGKKLIHGVVPKQTLKSIEDYIQVGARAGEHYKTFMGRTFAICSYLTYKLGAELETFGTTDPDLETAVILVWRRLYEGLALSGVSDKGIKMAEYIRKITKTNRLYISGPTYELLMDAGYENLISEANPNNPEETLHYVCGVDAVRYAWALINPNLPSEVAEYIYKAILVTGFASMLERELVGVESDADRFALVDALINEPANIHIKGAEILGDTIVFGMIRRGSKGNPVAAQLGDEQGNGLYHLCTDTMLANIGNGIVADLARVVRDVQDQVGNIRKVFEQFNQ